MRNCENSYNLKSDIFWKSFNFQIYEKLQETMKTFKRHISENGKGFFKNIENPWEN